MNGKEQYLLQPFCEDALKVISTVFQVKQSEIVDIAKLKKGMTNRSFVFTVHGEKYIMRVPGEGTDQLINRAQEAAVYNAIADFSLCDAPVYIDIDTGYKITKFINGVRGCNAKDVKDLRMAMKKLTEFHRLHLTVPHTFDLFERIGFYESLWNGAPSHYQDYMETKNKVFSLKDYVEKTKSDWCLSHIDAVPDNFLFYQTPNGEGVQLIDWEYAGMQDPHVDVAMFCIYSLYDKKEIDRLIALYFEACGEDCGTAVKAKIYAYISICGLLWSNWCEFKSHLGVEFDEYSVRQYQYAKDYCKYAEEEIQKSHADS